jgi:hypothetical protein
VSLCVFRAPSFGSDEEGKQLPENSNVCLKNDCSARFKGGILENNFTS